MSAVTFGSSTSLLGAEVKKARECIQQVPPLKDIMLKEFQDDFQSGKFRGADLDQFRKQMKRYIVGQSHRKIIDPVEFHQN